MPEAGEIPTNHTATGEKMNARRVDLNAVADVAQRWGYPDKAEQLRQLAKQPVNRPIETAKPVREKQPFDLPASSETRRFDTQDVDALLNAIEQAKKFPVPEGEEPGQFYYQKAMELVSQRKEQQK